MRGSASVRCPSSSSSLASTLGIWVASHWPCPKRERGCPACRAGAARGQSRLRLEGRTWTLSGPSPELTPAHYSGVGRQARSSRVYLARPSDGAVDPQAVRWQADPHIAGLARVGSGQAPAWPLSSGCPWMPSCRPVPVIEVAGLLARRVGTDRARSWCQRAGHVVLSGLTGGFTLI